MNYVFDIIKFIVTLGKSKTVPLTKEHLELKEKMTEMKSIIKYLIVALVAVTLWAILATFAFMEMILHA